MEIGLPYLMQLNNKYLKPDSLSIQIFKSGLFFCTKKENYFFDFKDLNFDSISVKNFIKKNKIEFDFVEVILFDENSIIIPDDFFDERKIENIVSTSMPLKSDYLVYDKIFDTRQVVLYYLKKENKKIINDFFPKAEIKHFTTQLFKVLSKFSKNNYKKNMFINLRDNFFDIFIYHSNQLLFFNTFNHETIEDFLYYVFYVIEIQGINQIESNVFFLGKNDKFNTYYNSFSKFYNSAKFLNSQAPNISQSNHECPLFLDIFE